MSRITVSQLLKFKQSNEKFSCITAYDASFAQLFESQEMPVLLVGDSLGMVLQGHNDTLPVTVDDIAYHTRCVRAGSPNCLLMADMPFMSYATPEQACENAATLMRAGANMVKIEGGSEHSEVIKTLISNNINICGHLGLQPQMVINSDEYRVQGRDENSAKKIIKNAVLLESLGVSALVLECIPSDLAQTVTEKLTIPTIGIGAGADCDGQVLVSFDMLGITSGKQPRFVRNFLNNQNTISDAIEAFVMEVKAGTFPNQSESY